MRNRLYAAAVVAFAALAGCGGSSPPVRSLWVGANAVPAPGETYRILPGAGIPDVMLGSDAGYFITANNGGSYRLVWTGRLNQAARYSHFYGSVYSTAGHFTGKVNGCNGGFCPLEADDQVSAVHDAAGGQRIDFDTFAGDGFDGFDFITDSEPVVFDLYIDDGQFPDLVFFPATDRGGQISSVRGFPFGLTTR